jgi:hypothetical protein
VTHGTPSFRKLRIYNGQQLLPGLSLPASAIITHNAVSRGVSPAQFLTCRAVLGRVLASQNAVDTANVCPLWNQDTKLVFVCRCMSADSEPMQIVVFDYVVGLPACVIRIQVIYTFPAAQPV